jgi:hypothetical protein
MSLDGNSLLLNIMICMKRGRKEKNVEAKEANKMINMSAKH